MRGPWIYARPVSAAQRSAAEMYVKREDLIGVLKDVDYKPLLSERLIQVVEQGGSLTIIEDTAKARSGDVPYR